MGRRARLISIMGFYHLILRGNDRMVLFEEEQDNRFFLKKMGKYTREEGILISAYCLMGNHVHMLVYDPENRASAMMQKLEISYTRYYNDTERAGHVGHVFQGPYLSEPINDECYLMNVFRYILNNPKKAGIAPANQYRWSSYKAFFRKASPLFLDFFREKLPTPAAYREYIGTPDDSEYMEDVPPARDDAWAIGIIRRKLGVKSGTEVKSWDKPRRDQALKSLKEAQLTNRQIERLTGISHSVVQRA